MRIVHVAPLHRRDDTRVFLKQCRTLSTAGHDIALVVADGQGDRCVDNVQVIDTGIRPRGKFARWILPLWRSMRCAIRYRPDVIHFHDGLFLPFGIALSIAGWKVVYDVHEDYRRQMLKSRFSKLLQYLMSTTYRRLETIGSRLFVAIVPATPAIARNFPADKTVLVQNFPLTEELVTTNTLPHTERPPTIVYVGGVSTVRGILPVVEAMHRPVAAGIGLEIAGGIESQALLHRLRQMPGWNAVKQRDWITRQEMARLFSDSRAGIVTYLPTADHLEAQPNKLFEYMASGLPVIASDFPHWRQIVEDAGCGMLVDPVDPDAIARAIRWIVDHPEEAEAMGRRGRESVEQTYNWEAEAAKLVGMYRQFESDASRTQP